MNKYFGILFIIFFSMSCDQNPYGRGMKLYTKHCADCHGADGIGLAKLIPPLKSSDYLANNQDKIACIIRQGLDSAITVNGQIFDFQKMPYNDQLDEVAIANIINFINNAWGNKIDFVQPQKIKEDLKSCPK